jgi:hypothetical protein
MFNDLLSVLIKDFTHACFAYGNPHVNLRIYKLFFATCYDD